MHILFITRKWPPAVGGMETYCVEMVQELRRLGHEVEVIALPGRADGGAPGGGALIRFGLGVAERLLRRPRECDVIHGGDLAIWPLVRLAALRAKGRPALVLSAHGTDVSLAARPSLPGRLYRVYMALAVRLLARDGLAVVANSEATAARVGALGFARTVTVPLGCRVTPAAPGEEDPQTLLFAGRLVARKGLSWFVTEVLPLLPFEMTLAVAGTRWDASEDAALADPRVKFLGPLPQEELWARMARALAVVVPNVRAGAHQFEGFGLVAAEAAAAGGLVLAARLDGYTTSVRDGVTGRLLPPGDAAAWRDAILDLAAQSPEARAARRAAARDAAAEAFAWGRVAADTAAVYGKFRGDAAVP